MKTPKRHFRIDDKLWTRFKEIAADKNITASDLLRELITDCIEENSVDTLISPSVETFDTDDIEKTKELAKRFKSCLGVGKNSSRTKELIDSIFENYPPEYLEYALKEELVHPSFYK